MSAARSTTLRHMSLEACGEFVAPGVSMSLIERELPIAPGAVEYDDRGSPSVLHIAPRRWFVPGPADSLHRKLLGLQSRGMGVLTDVDGKWQWLYAESGAGRRLLESTIDVDETLAARDCASTTLFDCPAILARRGRAFDLWIASSYLDGFRAAARTGSLG